MEISRGRAFGSEGRKSTHDFLSLYSHSTPHQDPRPPSQDNYLKTHDFLQPLERVERKGSTKEEAADDMSVGQSHLAPPPSVERLLPGGIGTYTINHISYVNQRAPKPDGSIFTVAQSTSMDRNDESSNCSSYTGSGFTLWEESAAKKRKAGKENMARTPTTGDSVSIAPQWAASSERPSQSSSNNIFTCHTSHSSQTNGQKSQSFIDIIKSAKVDTHDEEVDAREEFTIQSESKTTAKGNLKVKVDGKSTEQKPNTPRSKHSATEQRRRSKINDRFQMLRELIPRSDQKRDKASFLLEVIEYIHFLQEKVNKYEGSFQGWKEPEKLMPMINSPRPGESFVHQPCGVKSGSTPALLFARRIDGKNVTTSPAIPMTAQHPVELEMNTATNLKASDPHSGISKKAMALPLLPNFFTLLGSSGAVSQLPPRLASENTSQPQPRQSHTYACVSDASASGDKLKGKDLAIEGGTISVSSVYSKGLLNSLTQALQSSGVDLSQASISVQIELGKQANISSQEFCHKEADIPACNQVMKGSTVARSEESDQPLKKLKQGKS